MQDKSTFQINQVLKMGSFARVTHFITISESEIVVLPPVIIDSILCAEKISRKIPSVRQVELKHNIQSISEEFNPSFEYTQFE